MGILNRNRPINATAATLLIAAVIATGTYALTASLRSGSSEVVDPCRGLDDEQCEQMISKARDDFQRRYEAWLPTISTEEKYLRSLPQASMLNNPLPGQPDLASAVAAADMIVVGTSNSIRFNAGAGAVVTLDIESVVKGAHSNQVTIIQSGGPGPTEDWSSPVLAVSDADPILIPGDRAFLLLEATDDKDAYSVQSFTGHYRIDGSGRITPLEGNPFAAEVNGVTVDDFTDDVDALVSASQ